MFSPGSNCKLDSSSEMSSTEHRHRLQHRKKWSWIRSECLKVPTVQRYEKKIPTKNSNICQYK